MKLVLFSLRARANTQKKVPLIKALKKLPGREGGGGGESSTKETRKQKEDGRGGRRQITGEK